MAHWFYENWTAEQGGKATIHVGECAFCKNGTGIHPDPSEQHGRWHGGSSGFPSFEEAKAAAEATGRAVKRCEHCDPR